MACLGLIGGGHLGPSSPSASWTKSKVKNQRKKRTGLSVNASYSSVRVSDDPYQTLRIHPGASESEVRKAFRQLALQYHPDVCRGNNCGVQFHRINEAYDMVMTQLREETTESPEYYYDQGIDEPMRGVNDEEYDLWEEWMGWEGAGIRDYTSHINPYI